MKTIVLFAGLLLLTNTSASAASANGSSALALAALVAENSSALDATQRKVIARLFEGDLSVSYPADRKIVVKADAVVCRASNVDITARSCELKFGAQKATLKGRKAHELFATMMEAGVPPDGAAGSVFERLSNLSCTIDVGEIQEKAGGGAGCVFDQ
jgi:hypothetical protein